MVSDTLANTTRAAHDLGLATWFGGSMFGKFAHNPSLRAISDHRERGKVANQAWNGFNVLNGVGLGAAGLGWAAARLTEARPDRMSATENGLSIAKDVLMVTSLVTGIANGVQGARLAGQAPEGAGRAVADQLQRPTARRALTRRSNPGGGDGAAGAVSPFTLGAVVFAGLNELARRSAVPTPTS